MSSNQPLWNPMSFFEWPAMMTNSMQRYFSMFAPNQLNEPILPGWSFGNTYYLTEQNSSSPETEKAIVAANSYGRQLGKILDALTEIVKHDYGEEQYDKGDLPSSLLEIKKLHENIEKIKIAQIKIRLGRIKKDLKLLSEKDQVAYQEFLDQLP